MAATLGYRLNHTMFRIRDPKASLKFYCEYLGMEQYSKKVYNDFTLYFLAYNHTGRTLTDEEKADTRLAREGVLELTHNHGTELDPNFKYSNGNSDPGRGYGHIAISVDDVDKACDRLDKLGVPFQKKPNDGKMKGIAFVLDPDGYWVEIVPSQRRSHP